MYLPLHQSFSNANSFKKVIRLFSVLFITIISLQQATAQSDYYWVGGTGTWNDLTHWATESGGSTNHTIVPSQLDNVIFDANSFDANGQTVTVNQTAFSKDFIWDNVTNDPNFVATSYNLNIFGDFTATGTPYTYTHNSGNLIIKGDLIISGSDVNFSKNSGTMTVEGDLTIEDVTSDMTFNRSGSITIYENFTMSNAPMGSFSVSGMTLNNGDFVITDSSPSSMSAGTINAANGKFNITNWNGGNFSAGNITAHQDTVKIDQWLSGSFNCSYIYADQGGLKIEDWQGGYFNAYRLQSSTGSFNVKDWDGSYLRFNNTLELNAGEFVIDGWTNGYFQSSNINIPNGVLDIKGWTGTNFSAGNVNITNGDFKLKDWEGGNFSVSSITAHQDTMIIDNWMTGSFNCSYIYANEGGLKIKDWSGNNFSAYRLNSNSGSFIVENWNGNDLTVSNSINISNGDFIIDQWTGGRFLMYSHIYAYNGKFEVKDWEGTSFSTYNIEVNAGGFHLENWSGTSFSSRYINANTGGFNITNWNGSTFSNSGNTINATTGGFNIDNWNGTSFNVGPINANTGGFNIDNWNTGSFSGSTINTNNAEGFNLDNWIGASFSCGTINADTGGFSLDNWQGTTFSCGTINSNTGGFNLDNWQGTTFNSSTINANTGGFNLTNWNGTRFTSGNINAFTGGFNLTDWAGTDFYVGQIYVDDDVEFVDWTGENIQATFNITGSVLIDNMPDGTTFSSTSTNTIAGNFTLQNSDITFNAGSSYFTVSGDYSIPSGVVNYTHYGTLRIGKNFALSEDITYNHSGTIEFFGNTTGNTIDPVGNSFNNFTINGNGGEWTLLDDLKVNNTSYHYSGSFISDGHGVDYGRYFGANSNYTRSIDYTGTDTVHVGYYFFVQNSSSTNFEMGDAVLEMDDNYSSDFQLNCQGRTLNDIDITNSYNYQYSYRNLHIYLGNSTTGDIDISLNSDMRTQFQYGTVDIGNVTIDYTNGSVNDYYIYNYSNGQFGDFEITNSNSSINANTRLYFYGPKTVSDLNLDGISNKLWFESNSNNTYGDVTLPNRTDWLISANTTQTVESLFAEGDCLEQIYIRSNSSTNATISDSEGSNTIDFVRLKDITFTGGADWTADNAFTEGDNPGITIIDYPTSTYYWVGGTGSWTDQNHWSLTSGGTPSDCKPTEVDHVVFDENSFTGSNQTVTINSAVKVKSMTWDSVQYNPRLYNYNNAITLEEDFKAIGRPFRFQNYYNTLNIGGAMDIDSANVRLELYYGNVTAESIDINNCSSLYFYRNGSTSVTDGDFKITNSTLSQMYHSNTLTINNGDFVLDGAIFPSSNTISRIVASNGSAYITNSKTGTINTYFTFGGDFVIEDGIGFSQISQTSTCYVNGDFKIINSPVTYNTNSRVLDIANDFILGDASTSFSGYGTVYIGGSVELNSNNNFNHSGTFILDGTGSNKTISSGTKSFPNIQFNGSNSTWTLLDDFKVTNNTYHYNGSFVSDGFGVDYGRYFDANSSSIKTLDYTGTDIIYVDYYYRQSTSTNITLTLDNNTLISMDNPSGNTIQFYGGNKTYGDVYMRQPHSGTIRMYNNNTYNDVEIDYVSTVPTYTPTTQIYGTSTWNDLDFNTPEVRLNLYLYENNTFDTLSLDNGMTAILTNGRTQSMNAMVAEGLCDSYISIKSSSNGSASNLLDLNGGTNNINFVTLQDISATGATWLADEVIDNGNNSGMDITPAEPVTYYWIGGTGNWNDSDHWSLSSGGTTSNCVPGILDDVIFDINSFSAANQNVSVTEPTICRNMTWTSDVNSNPRFNVNSYELEIQGNLLAFGLITWNQSSTLRAGGDFKLNSNISFNKSGNVFFYSDSTNNVINIAGDIINGNVYFDKRTDEDNPGWKLESDFNIGNNYNTYFNTGTFESNGFEVDFGTGFYANSGSNARSLDFTGTETVAVNDQWYISTNSNTTLEMGTADVEFNSSCYSCYPNFYGGNKIYNDLIIYKRNYWQRETRIYNDNTFNDIQVNYLNGARYDVAFYNKQIINNLNVNNQSFNYAWELYYHGSNAEINAINITSNTYQQFQLDIRGNNNTIDEINFDNTSSGRFYSYIRNGPHTIGDINYTSNTGEIRSYYYNGGHNINSINIESNSGRIYNYFQSTSPLMVGDVSLKTEGNNEVRNEFHSAAHTFGNFSIETKHTNSNHYFYSNCTFGDYIVNATGNGDAYLYMASNNSFDKLVLPEGFDMRITSSRTQTIEEFIPLSSCNRRSIIRGDNAFSSRISQANGIVSGDWMTLQNHTAIGGATFNATNSVQSGTVSGWDIMAEPPLTFYWVGGTGNWNDPNHWSYSSGGEGNGCVIPVAKDNAVFDANSFTAANQNVTVNIYAQCKNMVWEDVQFQPTFSANYVSLTINGDLILDSDMTWNFFNHSSASYRMDLKGSLSVGEDVNWQHYRQVYFSPSTGDHTIDMGGNEFYYGPRFRGANTSSWTLTRDLKVRSNETTYLEYGHLKSDGYDIDFGNQFYSTTGSARSLDITGSEEVKVRTQWYVTSNNFNLIADGSVVKIEDNTFGTKTFRGGNQTYDHVEILNTYTANSQIRIYDNNTIEDFVIDYTNRKDVYLYGNNTIGTFSLKQDYANTADIPVSHLYGQNDIGTFVILSLSTQGPDITFSNENTFGNFISVGRNTNLRFASNLTQTFNGPVQVLGTGGQPIFMNATTDGVQATLTRPEGNMCFDFIWIKDINATGGAVYNGGLNGIDLGNNDGINFDENCAGYYWVGGSGNWSDTDHWATSSGGTFKHLTAPSLIDDVYFDANSFDATGQTVTLDVDGTCANMDWLSALFTPTLEGTANKLSLHGSLVLTPDMNQDWEGEWSFEGDGDDQTIDTKGIELTDVTFDDMMLTGGYQLIKPITVSNTLTFKDGVFDSNGEKITAESINIETNNSKEIQLSDSKILIKEGKWNVLDNGNLVLDAGTSEIVLTSDSGDVDFHGGNMTYNDVTFTTETAMNATINDDNTYNTLTIEPKITMTVEASSTQTTTELIAGGNCNDNLIMVSSTDGTQATFSQASGTVSSRFLEMQDIAATGGATFETSLSEDNGNNSGWTFLDIDEIQLDMQVTNATCPNPINGSITADVVGGVAPFDYKWSNLEFTETISNLSQGTYSVTVTDDSGCIVEASANITQPASYGFTAEGTDETICYDAGNGTATVSTTGAATPLAYQWNTGSDEEILTGLNENTYAVTVTDANNCIAAAISSVTERADLNGSFTYTNDNCTGTEMDFTASASGVGLSYDWDFGDTNTASGATASNTFADAGEYTVTLTVTDENMCTDVIVQTVNIKLPPAVEATVANTTSCSPCNGLVSFNITGGTAPYQVVGNPPTTGLCEGMYEFVIVDNNGCLSETVEVEIILNDLTKPVIHGINNITVSADENCMATVTSLGTATVTDDCTTSGLTATNDATSTSYELGTTIVTWTTSADEFGNIGTLEQTITVVDNTYPSITAPEDVTVEINNECTAISVDLGDAVVSDNCNSSITPTNNAPSAYSVGTTAVTWYANDGNGQTSTDIQYVTVIAADINVRGNGISISDGDTSPNSSDHTDFGQVIGEASRSFSIENNGADDLLLTGSPVVGIAGDSEFTVEIQPTASGIDAGDPSLSFEVKFTAQSAGIRTATVTIENNDCDEGPYTFDVRAESVCSINITDADATNTSCPDSEDGSLTVTATCNSCTGNNEDIRYSIDGSDFSNTTGIFEDLAAGTYTITVRDVNNISCIATSSATINNTADTTPPTITCPDDITVNADENLCTTAKENVTLGTPTTDDNCGVMSTENDEPDTYALGDNTVTWTITDNAGLTTTCTQTVTVIDSQAPTITCPDDITVNADENLCTTAKENVTLGTPTTDDNCGVKSTENNEPDTYPLGDNTVTWTVTDDAGLTTTCTQTVTVVDNQAPTITCPDDITVNADDNLCTTAKQNVMLGSPTTDDNCGVMSIENNKPDTYSLGDNTVTWTVTDDAGLTTTCTQTVTVIDNQAPTITCPDNVTVNADENLCTTAKENVMLGSPTTDDNCGVMSTENNEPDTYALGDNTVTWTVTDDAGLTSTCTQTVTVIDSQAPTITCPDNVTVNADENLCTTAKENVMLGSPTTDDNCGVMSTENNEPDTYALGDNTVTWTVTDDAGLTTTCTQTVTVIDSQAPTITCPDDITVNTDENLCSTAKENVTLGTPTTDDNCGVMSTENDEPDTYALGDNTVTWTVTDNAGLTTTCTQTVTVVDNQAPTITCPADITVGTDENENNAALENVNLGTPTTNDNCGVMSIDNNAPNNFILGDNTVAWTVTDDAGLTTTCEQTVTVIDDQEPTISCPANITVSTNEGVCNTTLDDIDLGMAIANDNSGIMSLTHNAPDILELGEHTITWTATDNAGASVTCEQTVTVVDTEAPTITCPDDVTSFANQGACNAADFTVDLGTPITDDNCGVMSVANDAPSVFDIGNTTVTWTITDNAGNTTTCEQLVTIVDTQDPIIDCPIDITVYADENSCTIAGENVELGSATTTDNCGVMTTENDAPDTYDLGTNTVVWTVTDDSGLTSSCTQIVTVLDNQAPTINCPGNITVNTDDGTCTTALENVSLSTPTTNDECGVMDTEHDAPDNFDLGENIITWTVTDESGNTATCMQTVTVIDNQAPIITCAEDFSGKTDEGLCYAILENIGTPTVVENCAIIEISNDAPDQFPIGTTTVTWTVTDESGNQDQCEQLVIIGDSEIPEITCPAAITVNVDANSCEAIVDLSEPEYSDNCGIEELFHDAKSAFGIGTTEVQWIVVDESGNTNTCVQMVTVIDNLPPTINCPEILEVTTDGENCEDIVVNLITPEANDNCNEFTITNNAPQIYSVGETTVTWTVTDAAGLSTTCDQIINIIDVDPPTIICPDPNNITLEVSPTATEYTVTTFDLDANALDNCNVTLTNDYNNTNSLNGASLPVGEHTITWTATDSNNNSSTCEITVTVVNAYCIPAFSLADGINDCPTENFYIQVDVTDVGIGEVVDITNDGGAPTLFGVTAGVHVVGPFAGSTAVAITVTNPTDNTCIDTQTWTTLPDCPEDSEYFITTWVINSDGESITIPTIGSGYDYDVIWGDGYASYGHDGNATHTYDEDGTYEVKIKGDFPRIYFNNSGDINKIASIEQWGEIQWTSMKKAFKGCFLLDINTVGSPDLDLVTNMDEMFYGCMSLDTHLNTWDVSNVTSMKYVFKNATSFNGDITDWDVSAVTDMSGMFDNAANFNQAIGDWTVTEVVNMNSMFNESGFNKPIGDWDVAKVNDMDNMFSYTEFDQPLNDWVVSSVNTMREMFFDNISFDQDLNDWDVSQVKYMTKMFEATLFNSDITTWDVSNVELMNSMFEGNGNFNQNLGDWDVESVTDMRDMFNGSVSFDQDLSNWNMTSVTQADNMFKNVTLTTDFYDNMLINWQAQPLQNNVNFSGGNSVYCNGKDAREDIESERSWNITDGGYNSEACILCTFVVTNTDNEGEGSLRSAITCANTFPRPDTIRFDISGVGPHIIDLVSDLPSIEDDSTVIDATTQPDNYPMNGEIAIDMTSLTGTNTVAINVEGKDIEIYGIDFRNFDDTGNQTAINYQSGADNFVLGDSLRGNWFSGNQYHVAVFTKENIDGGKIQSNKFETEEDSIHTAILINSGTSKVIIGGEKENLGNEFIRSSYTAIEMRNGSHDNIIMNNYFRHNRRAIFNNGNYLGSTANEGNEYWNNTYICNEDAIYNTTNANLGIAEPTILYSKTNFVYGEATPGSIVEIYAAADTCVNADVLCAGGVLIGRDSVGVDGRFKLILSDDDHIPLGYAISATQTDTLSMGTSQFSSCMPTDDECFTFVYTCFDDGEGSLRKAIECAEDGETVEFMEFLEGETIILESELDIDKNIVLEGLGNPGIRVMSNAHDYNLKITNDKEVEINNLIMCVNDEGASSIIKNGGSLILKNVTIIDKREEAEHNIENLEGSNLIIEEEVKIIKE